MITSIRAVKRPELPSEHDEWRFRRALVIGDSVFFTSRREQLVTRASRYAVPAIERWREFAFPAA